MIEGVMGWHKEHGVEVLGFAGALTPQNTAPNSHVCEPQGR